MGDLYAANGCSLEGKERQATYSECCGAARVAGVSSPNRLLLYIARASRMSHGSLTIQAGTVRTQDGRYERLAGEDRRLIPSSASLDGGL